MKLLSLWSVFAFLVFCAGAVQAGMPAAAVVRQDIAVTLEPENHLLTGLSTITFAAGAREVALRLSAGARIDSVAASGAKVAFSFADGLLSLHLPPGRAGEAIPVTVSYRAAFNDAVSQHPAGSEDPSYGVNGAITGEGTFLGGGAYWYPVPAEVPRQRSISIAAPAGTEAVTAGRRVSRETSGGVTRSVWEEARPVGVLSLCAGTYQVEQRRVDGVDLYTYFYRDNAALAPKYLDAAARYLHFYSELFGAYPFEKFAVVENFFPTGYGFPSFTLLGGSVLRLPFIIETSFPHEIAHCWWGNGIDADQREGNWSEGLVTYLADYLLKERRSAVEARDYRRQLLIDYASLVTPALDFPLSAFSSRSDPASRAIGYGKGAMVFHMVRNRIGDRAFFGALREICRDHMYRSASWSDFTRAFSRSAGRDLTPFMKQWLTQTGGPRLSLAEVTSRRAGRGWQVLGTVVQGAPLFELPAPLGLETTDGEVREQVAIRGERAPFTIATAAAPVRLRLDPGYDIFRILSRGEIPATVNSIKGSSRLLGVMTTGCRATPETFGKLLASLSREAVPVLSETELGKRPREDRDLIFCGVPRDPSLLPELPPGVELSEAEFSIDAAHYAAPDGLLFLVLPFPGPAGRVAALFQPLSDAAARLYTPKITHYGKYGYLVFADGANRLKGTAPASDGAAVVRLKP